MVSDTKSILLATVVMVVLFITGAFMLSTVNSYNPSVLGNASSTFRNLNASMWNMEHNLRQISNKTSISNVTTSEGTWGFIDYTFKSAIGIMKVTGSGMLFLVTFFSNIGNYLGLPSPFAAISNLLGTIITFILFFAFIKLITKAD